MLIMGSKKINILLSIVLASSGLLIFPTSAFAVMQNLNGQTGQTQTFQNDSNITISSSGNVHSFGWNGILPFSRGGTGASAFTSGSVLFSNGTSFAQNNSDFFWDNVNNRLGIGTSSPALTLDVVGDASISGNLNLGTEGSIVIISTPDATTNNVSGAELSFELGAGLGTGAGGTFSIEAGLGGVDGEGGGITFDGGTGGLTSGNGGLVAISAGNAVGSGNGGVASLASGKGGITSGDGGRLELFGGSAQGGNGNGGDVLLLAGLANGTGDKGKIIIQDGSIANAAVLDTANLTTNPFTTFAFPDFSGTFGLLEANQTWNGLNLFEAGSNSTIYVGSLTKSGCIALGDSDDDGITYITANDGVISASSTKPSTCQ